MEEVLLTCFKYQRTHKIPISGPILQQKWQREISRALRLGYNISVLVIILRLEKFVVKRPAFLKVSLKTSSLISGLHWAKNTNQRKSLMGVKPDYFYFSPEQNS